MRKIYKLKYYFALLNSKHKIFNLIFRLLFYSYFIVWSLLVIILFQNGEINTPSNGNDEYLISAQTSALPFTLNEENKRFKYFEEKDSGFYFPGKFLGSSCIQNNILTGNIHFVEPGSIPVPVNINIFIDHPRPPPVYISIS